MEAKDTVVGNTLIWVEPNATVDIKRQLEKQAETTWPIAFKAGIREVLPFATKFLEMAMHGDYSNGNDAFGVDEGRVRAHELLQQYEIEWQAFLKEKGFVQPEGSSRNTNAQDASEDS